MASTLTEFKIEINQTDMREFRNLVERIGGKALKAMSRAINRTMAGKSPGKGKRATGGLIQAVTDILREEINLTATTLKKGPSTKGKVARKNRTFVIERATPTKPIGTFTVQSANIPLIHYSNQRGNRAKHAKKVEVQVRKDRGKVRLRYAFVPPLASGHRGLFNQLYTMGPGGKRKPVRNAKGNIRIRELYGPRISDLYSNQPVLEQRVLPVAEKKLHTNLEHEMDWLLQEEGQTKLND